MGFISRPRCVLGYDTDTNTIFHHFDNLHLTHLLPEICPLLRIKMKQIAAYLLLVLGGNDSPTAADVTKALAAVGVESDAASLTQFLAEMEGKDLDETIAAGKELLAKFGSGGGGGAASGAGAAAVEVVEEEEEEEEAGPGDAVDMFGGDGGDGKQNLFHSYYCILCATYHMYVYLPYQILFKYRRLLISVMY
jgi:ribosomal protein L12E/L44/L45/RPP1/RPP2